MVSMDKSLFLGVNGCNSQFWDGVMYAISGKFTWVPLYMSVLYVVVKQWTKEALWVVLSMAFCILISDQVASGIIKNLVQRLRPSHITSLNGMVHLVKGYTGGLYGFVSSHASNSVGFALLSSLFFREKIYTILITLWVLLICYSRVYLGVHYPLDIFGGALVGAGAAGVCWYVLKLYRPSIFERNEVVNTIVPVSVLITSLVLILSYSLFLF
jgi:undecaprenyl-diphosphatase